MKDQYFGDVNDYRKYRLLRTLTLDPGLRLGVCWMLTEPDGRSDGRHLAYLHKERDHRHHDPELFDWLRTAIHEENDRRTRRIEASRLLGDAVFQSRLLSDSHSSRRAYFNESKELFCNSDLVFFDPDNGMERRIVRGRKASSKYLYWDELTEFYNSGSSVLLYQHFPREPRAQFITVLAAALKEQTKTANVFAFATSFALFLLAIHPRHENKLTIPASTAGGVRPI